MNQMTSKTRQYVDTSIKFEREASQQACVKYFAGFVLALSEACNCSAVQCRAAETTSLACHFGRISIYSQTLHAIGCSPDNRHHMCDCNGFDYPHACRHMTTHPVH